MKLYDSTGMRTSRGVYRRALIASIFVVALLLGGSSSELNSLVLAQAVPSVALPAATHAIDFGYENMDGRGTPSPLIVPPILPSFQAEVWHYTNLYVANPCTYDSDFYPPGCPTVSTQFENSLDRAKDAGKSIYLYIFEATRDAELSVMTPARWASVKYVEVAHEQPELNNETLEARIALTKSKITALGLDVGTKLFGITLGVPDAVAGHGGTGAPSLDFVNVEAYLEPQGSNTSQVNVDQLNANMDAALAAIPATKKIVWWMMSYDRTGSGGPWTNINTLKDIQAPVYLKSYNNPRVVGIIMFGYGRVGGTRAHPELKIEHRRIAEKLYYQNPICLIACDGDVDGNHRGDLTVFRPSTGYWYHLLSNPSVSGGAVFTPGPSYNWGGLLGDIAVDGDFDGDGKMDAAVYRASGGNYMYWYIRYSSGTGESPIQHGLVNDIPIAADFDGDGKVDLTVFRPSTGEWHVRYSSGTYEQRNVVYRGSPDQGSPYSWGLSGDVPVTADFDGDGRSEMAVYRPSNGGWYILYSTKAYASSQSGFFQWGLQDDQPIAADFDGDGKADIAVFRPGTAEWFIRYSSLAYAANQGNWYYQWGLPSAQDQPITADFDGDGKGDIAVFRPGTGEWFIRYSSLGYAANQGNWYYQWGLSGDVPLPRPNR
jgi:hypothetical protein